MKQSVSRNSVQIRLWAVTAGLALALAACSDPKTRADEDSTAGNGTALGDTGTADSGTDDSDTTVGAPDPGAGDAATGPSDGVASADTEGEPAILFGEPCGNEPCEGPDGLCVQTAAGPLCSRRCVGDATCEAGWRCVYCADQCVGGEVYQHCVPPADATLVVACKEEAPGFVGVIIPNTGSDKLLTDEPCTVAEVDAEELKVTMECSGAADATVTIDLTGNSAVLPPALQAGVPVRVTWQEEGDSVSGPVHLIVRDAAADSLIFAYVWGMMNQPVPYGEQEPWLFAPLLFNMHETSCPLEQDECHTWMRRALEVTSGSDTIMLVGPELAQIGAGPAWQVYLAGASRTVSPLGDSLCSDIVYESLSMIVTRVTD